MKNWSTELADLARDSAEAFRRGYVELPAGGPVAPASPIAPEPSAAIAAAAPVRVPASAAAAAPLAAAVDRPDPAAVVARLGLEGLDPGSAIDRIAAGVRSCTACGLCQTRSKAVPGVGSIHPVALVIGEAPGADEDRLGLPFVGAAGQFLDKWLEAIGLSRYSNIYIANTLKCRPPANRDPEPGETRACADWLAAQITVLKPKAVLAVGRHAAAWLAGEPVAIGAAHGSVRSWHGIPWLPTYHPSAVLRSPDLKRPVWEDLKAFKDLLGS